MLVQIPITKGPHLKFLDSHFGGQSANFLANYDAALAALQPDADLGALAQARLGQLPQEAIDHFKDHWLGGGDDWWPGAQPIAPVLVAGLTAAITAAKQAQVPMHFVWVSGATADVQVAFSKSDHQVTVYFLTPTAGEPPNHRANDVTVWGRDAAGNVKELST